MKDQFQATEVLRVRITPFLDKVTGDFIMSGTDTVTLTIRKPDGTLHTGGTVTATWDSTTKLWIYDVSTGSYQQGEWRVHAVTNDSNSQGPKWQLLTWGDYVEDITLARSTAQSINTKLGTPTGASVSADVAAVKTDTTAIKAKTDSLPASPANEITLNSVATEVGLTKIAAQAAQSSSAAAASDTAIVRKINVGRWKVIGTQLVLYELNGVTEFMRFDLSDELGNPSGTRIFERTPV
jgi:hypothetical protein